MSQENPYAPIQVSGDRQSSKARSDLRFYFAMSTLVLMLFVGWSIYKVRNNSLRFEDDGIVIEERSQSSTNLTSSHSITYMNYPVVVTLIALAVVFANGLVWFVLSIRRYLVKQRSVALE